MNVPEIRVHALGNTKMCQNKLVFAQNYAPLVAHRSLPLDLLLGITCCIRETSNSLCFGGQSIASFGKLESAQGYRVHEKLLFVHFTCLSCAQGFKLLQRHMQCCPNKPLQISSRLQPVNCLYQVWNLLVHQENIKIYALTRVWRWFRARSNELFSEMKKKSESSLQRFPSNNENSLSVGITFSDIGTPSRNMQLLLFMQHIYTLYNISLGHGDYWKT